MGNQVDESFFPDGEARSHEGYSDDRRPTSVDLYEYSVQLTTIDGVL
jgi:hypothetical protein